MISQWLMINTCKLHQESQRIVLQTFLATPFDKLIEARLGVLELNTGSITTYITRNVVHLKACYKLLLRDINTNALTEVLP